MSHEIFAAGVVGVMRAAAVMRRALLSACASSIINGEDKACAAGLQRQPESGNPNLLFRPLTTSCQLMKLFFPHLQPVY